MKNDITLAYPYIKGNSGTKSYVENTFNGLNKLGVKYNSIQIRKREISIRGKPYFGILTQYASSLLKSGRTRVVHALSPDVVIRGTNIVTIHDIIPFTNPDIYLKSSYDRRAFDMSFSRSLSVKYLLVSTEVGKSSLIEKRNISPEKIKVIYHSIDHSKFFPEENNPYPEDGKLNILMVSDFNPRKRIDIIIDSIGGDKEINFYHAGPSQSWSYRQSKIVEKAKEFENVKFLGELDQINLRRYLTFSDLFIFLSDNEGFGLPPIEAMACGTNVLVNNLGVFKEILGSMAHYVDLTSFTREDILSSIKNRKTSAELLGFSKKFSIENHASKLIQFYNSVLQ